MFRMLQVTHTTQMLIDVTFTFIFYALHIFSRNNQGCNIFIPKMSCMALLGSTRMCTKQMSHCFVLIKDYKGKLILKP